MPKTILITGATDGIGLETAKLLAAEGHSLLLHGRSKAKLDALPVEGARYLADLSRMSDVVAMADRIAAGHARIDVLINNAGIFKTPAPATPEGNDIRFEVNTLAPYLLTNRLLGLMPKNGRVVNLSSAAQAPVDTQALRGGQVLSDMEAYAQSKLAITIWSEELAAELPEGPAIYAVNPGSLLASKMVKEGFGVAGSDLSIGADILRRAALSEEFEGRSGQYFDNDARQFAPPHPGGQSKTAREAVMAAIEAALADRLAG